MAASKTRRASFLSAPDMDVDVLIARGSPGAADDHCKGPDAEGNCPRVAAGDRVPCAGRHLLAHGLPIEGWDIRVRDDATGCPLAWLLTRLRTADGSYEMPTADGGNT